MSDDQMLRQPNGGEEDLVTLRLREMLFRGDFPPGSKLVEAVLAERLGVSRMPVRRALAILQRDGLVDGSPRRICTVARFTVDEVLQARDVRGTLDGMAARLVAEGGLDPAIHEKLEDIIGQQQALFSLDDFDGAAAERYGHLNQAFHLAIVEAAGSRPLSMAYAANNRLPLADPVAVSVDTSNIDEMAGTLKDATEDHRRILEAMARGSGTRVEALMREHALRSIEAFAKHAKRLHELDSHAMPGLRLVVT